MGWFSSLVGGIVGFFIGGPVGAVIGAGVGATKVGEKIVNTVLDFVTQPFMPNMPDMGGGNEADRQQGILVQTQGSTVNVPVVYGYRKLGGAVTFAETGSTDNKYLYVSYVFAEGLVEGLREIFIDDYQIPVSLMANLNAGQLVNITTEKYANRVQMRWSPGVYYTNPKLSTLGSTVKGDIFAEAPSFTADMNYNGLATLFVRYEWKKIETPEDQDNNPFSGSIPQVQVCLLGKRVASLLVNSTETSTYDVNNIRYSTNPAECLLDYLRNPRYGKGLTNDDINWETWKKAARKCNQTVTYVASGITGPILTVNMVLDTDSTLMSNTKLLLQNFRAYMPYVQGKYKLRIEDAGNDDDILSGAATIVQTFTKDDIVSDITFNGIERSAKYNVVSVTYVDPDQKWSNQQVVYPESETERQTYIALDGNRENKYETTLGGITNYAIAKDFARLIFNKQRRQESCVFTATSKALELEPGDCIRIQSNLLNFGTDPWRIVSYKVNNDMSVDLGCVRNPDDIYPYVRAGEEDIVLPTYVPKGSIIYFPSSQNLPPVGLVPPTYAVFPPSTAVITPLPTNPPPTNPEGVDGGGVGGGTPNGGTAGPIVTEPTTPPTTPTPPTNVAPTPVAPPPPFSAVLTLKSSKAVKQSTGGYIYYLTFTQPSAALYDKSVLWWRPNAASPWTSTQITDKPGAGGDINWSLGPLPAGQYEFAVKSYASNGDVSNQQLQGVISVPPNAAELNPSLTGIATASAVAITLGWNVAVGVAPVARYDDEIELFKIKPKLVANSIQNPRRMSVEVAQIASTYGKVFNYGIQGLRIYYKYTSDTYWFYEDFNFETLGNPYYPGKTLSFDLAGDFGVAGSLSTQNYTFAAKLLYKDGKAAEKYLAPLDAPVESYIGRNNFVSYGTDPNAAMPSYSRVIASTWSPQTIDPAAAYTLGSDIKPSIFSISCNPSKSILTWIFVPPTSQANKWRGYKIRFREVIPGVKTDYITIEVGPTVDAASSRVYYTLENAGYSHNKTYEWAVTAQYSNNGVLTDCDTTLYAKGVNVPFNFYTYSNLIDYFSFVELSTKIALGNLITTFPATPNIIAQSWTKIQKRAAPPTISGQISANSWALANAADIYRANSTNYYINRWYRLKFSAPAGYNQIVVYRRVYDTVGAVRTTVGSVAKYYGLGAWEKTVISMPSADVDGFRTINLRGPVDPGLFNITYEVQAGTTLLKQYYGPSGVYPSSPGLTDIYPYYGSGNTYNVGTVSRYVEFLIVLSNSGTEQTKALRLRDFYAAEYGDGFKSEVEGFGAANVVNNEIVNVSDYNNYTANYKRNINEALRSSSNANILATSLHVGTNPIYPPNYFGTPNSSNFGSTYTILLSNIAEDGTVIY